MRRCGLYTAVLLLAVLLPCGGGRAAEPGTGVSMSGGRVIIATSHAPSPTPLPPAVSAAPLPLPPAEPAPDTDLRLAAPAPPAAVQQTHFPPAPPDAGVPRPAVAEKPNPGPGQTVSLYVEMVGPAEHNIGEPLACEIVVRNPGSTPAAQVRVQDDLAAATQLLKAEPPAEVHEQHLTWDLGTLPAGAERRIRLEVLGDSDGEWLGPATATCAAVSALRTHITRPRLALSVTGPDTVELGEEVPFRLRVTNNGTGPAGHVVVHDHLPAGLHHAQGSDIEADLGALAPGQSKVVTLVVASVQGGPQTNEVSARAEGGLQAKASATVRVVQARLLLRKTGPARAVLNESLDYRLEVVNAGDVPATRVRLMDALPEGLEFLAADNGGACTAATRTVAWDLGTLAPGQARAVSVKVLARKAGDWVNQAEARGENGPAAKAGAAVHVEGLAAAVLKVAAADNPVEVGAGTTYELRVVNQGAGACTGVRLRAVVPDGLDVLSAEGPTGHRVEGKQVTFEPLPRLAGKADAVFRVRVRARREGDWRLQAYLVCDQMQGPVYVEECTQVYDGEKAAPGPGKGKK